MKVFYFFYTGLLGPIINILVNALTIFPRIIIKRDPKVLLFGAWEGHRYAGNPRALYQYLSMNKEKYNLKNVVWVTRSREQFSEISRFGFETYMMYSLKSFYYHFKSGIHIISGGETTSFVMGIKRDGDIMGRLSMGAEHINLEHCASFVKGTTMINEEGSGLKFAIVKIWNSLNSNYFLRHYFFFPGGWDSVTVITTNNRTRDDFLSSTDNRVSVKVAGYPELCKPLAFTKKEKQIIKNLPKDKLKVLYVPTYRTNQKTNYYNPLNIEEFVEFIRGNNIYWIEKLRPESVKTMSAKSYPMDCSFYLDSDFDINLFLDCIDVIVTDYSSAYQKAVFINKPMLFFTPDYDGYARYDKGLLNSFKADVEAIRADNIEQLKQLFLIVLENKYFNEERKQLYERIRKDVFNGNSSYEYEDICSMLFEEMK